ncbi:O-antigen ligase family protein [Hymenobacter defluvii]|uniref:O-antigen ligase family protein n=1 Tax=Hymenobacter defluvii TaxID=2054411 RepID=A0ABS3TI94_9BACT|nr:O-antigen ligase family protein [Hymenobacter defluvii]MBO3273392.1 O-antigen ligase family protein [Hymenobacter defluvii]
MRVLAMQRLKYLYQQGLLSQYVLLLACFAGVVGLLTSRALVAISPIVGVVAVLMNPNLRAAVPGWLRNQSAWWLALLYALLLFSGLYTSAWTVWRHELYRKLPFLAIPLAFALAVPLRSRQRYWVGVAFTIGVTAIGLATAGRYWLSPSSSNEELREATNLQSVTGIFHIHFGVMLAMASVFGFLLGQNARTLGSRWLLWISGFLSALVLHALVYRTGLLAFYVMLSFNTLRLLMSRRWWKIGLLLLVTLVAAPLVAYHTVPSVSRQIVSSQYDIEQFDWGQDINNYSLAKRLAAWHTAITIAQANPWLGVGAADATDEMMAQYSWRSFGLLPLNRVMVHNQYLHFLLVGGLVGLALWLLVLLGPLAQPALRRNPYVYNFLLIQGAAMLVDSLLEIQISFNLFVFCYGFLLVAIERQSADLTK